MNISAQTRTPGPDAWYAIRVAAGAQRVARTITGAAEERVAETLLERECREKGIAVFMPSFWTVVRHQRTNKLIQKRFPFLVGYAFVRVAGNRFSEIKKFNHVAYFLRGGGHYGLASFTDPEMVQLYVADFEGKELHETMKKNGEADVRTHKRKDLNHQLGLIFPKGRRKKVPLRMMAAAAINSLSPKARDRCQSLLKELELLDREEDTCKNGKSAVISAA